MMSFNIFLLVSHWYKKYAYGMQHWRLKKKGQIFKNILSNTFSLKFRILIQYSI